MVNLEVTYADHTKVTFTTTHLSIVEGVLWIFSAEEAADVYMPTDLIPLYTIRRIAVSPA